jgi:hypothetical protein
MNIYYAGNSYDHIVWFPIPDTNPVAYANVDNITIVVKNGNNEVIDTIIVDNVDFVKFTENNIIKYKIPYIFPENEAELKFYYQTVYSNREIVKIINISGIII